MPSSTYRISAFRGSNRSLVFFICLLRAVKTLPPDQNPADGSSCLPRPDACNAEDFGTYLPCFGAEGNCSYTKGPLPEDIYPTVPPNKKFAFPPAPVDVTVSEYYDLYSGCKVPALNISWRAPVDVSLYALMGYTLNVMKSSSNETLNITRSFYMPSSAAALTSVGFYYPCIVADYKKGSQYHLHVYSLPQSDSNMASAEIYVPPRNFFGLNDSYHWMPFTTLTSGPGLVHVSFEAAPSRFGFTRYEVTLRTSGGHDSDSDTIVERVQLNHTDNKNIVHEFRDVKRAAYVVWIQVVPTSDCTCHVGLNFPEDCRYSCVITHLTITVDTGVVTTSAPVDTTPRPTLPPGHWSIIYIIIGALVAFLVILVLIALLRWKTNGDCKKQFRKLFEKLPLWKPQSDVDLESQGSDENANPNCDRQPNVLLVSCGTYRSHCDIVEQFTKFLRDELSGCYSVVTALDEREACERPLSALLPPQSLVDRLHRCASRADYVVLVHSIEDELNALSYMRWDNNVLDRVDAAPPQMNEFIATIRLSANGTLPRHKLLHVYFAYTDTEPFANARSGEMFQLPADTGRLIAHLRTSVQPTPTSDLQVVIPDSLQAAIDEACQPEEIEAAFEYASRWLPCFLPPEEVQTIGSDDRLTVRVIDFQRWKSSEDVVNDSGFPSVHSSL